MIFYKFCPKTSAMIKKIILKILKFLGYELIPIKTKKINTDIKIEPRKNKSERDVQEYDKVWSNNEFIVHYTEQHMNLYNHILIFIDAENVMQRADTIADIGCGPGNIIGFLSEKYPDKKYFGYDFSPTVIGAAQHRFKKIDFQTHDIYEPINKKFDFVICSETLEHLLHPAKAFENILNATNQTCLITVPDGRIDNYQGHINFWSEESFDSFLSNYSSDWIINVQKKDLYLFALLHKISKEDSLSIQ